MGGECVIYHESIIRLLYYLMELYEREQSIRYSLNQFKGKLMIHFGPDVSRRINPLINFLKSNNIIEINKVVKTEVVDINVKKLEEMYNEATYQIKENK